MLTSCLISLHCWSFCPESFTVNINPLHLLISALLSDMRDAYCPLGGLLMFGILSTPCGVDIWPISHCAVAEVTGARC